MSSERLEWRTGDVMEPSASTQIDCQGETTPLGVAAELMDAGPDRCEEVAALLRPMVRRLVRTRRGPAALLCWFRRRRELQPAPGPQELAVRLADDLARLLSDAARSPADTLGDS